MTKVCLLCFATLMLFAAPASANYTWGSSWSPAYQSAANKAAANLWGAHK